MFQCLWILGPNYAFKRLNEIIIYKSDNAKIFFQIIHFNRRHNLVIPTKTFVSKLNDTSLLSQALVLCILNVSLVVLFLFLLVH